MTEAQKEKKRKYNREYMKAYSSKYRTSLGLSKIGRPAKITLERERKETYRA